MRARNTSKKMIVTVSVFMLIAASVWASGKVEPNLPSLLVESEWLLDRVDHDNLVVIDTGRSADAYNAGHVPGAVYLDRSVYYGEVDGVSGMFTATDPVADALTAAGVNDDSLVVVYDSGNGLWATRLFWTLELLGHSHAVVLNGGSTKWVADGYTTSTVPASNPTGDFTPAYRTELVVAGEEISGSLDEFTVVDTRSAGEYTGEDARADRGGHIPGAININWVLNNTGGDVSTFLPVYELEEFYNAMIGSESGKIVTHCQTGVRGAHTYFVLRLLGYEDVALYDASWVEWGNSELFPVAN